MPLVVELPPVVELADVETPVEVSTDVAGGWQPTVNVSIAAAARLVKISLEVFIFERFLRFRRAVVSWTDLLCARQGDAIAWPSAGTFAQAIGSV